MNITPYLRAGFGAMFIETKEINRAAKTINTQEPFKIMRWNIIDGLSSLPNEDISQIEVLEKAKEFNKTAIILENFDNFLDNITIVQCFLSFYEQYKAQQVCLVIVGADSSKIPITLKEILPVFDFNLPNKIEIQSLLNDTSDNAKESLNISKKTEEEKKEYALSFNGDHIDACAGMTYEEIENTLALSLVQEKHFNLPVILDRKKHILRSTGFMDFINPEPIENLGGLGNLKIYFEKRIEPFKNPKSIKPKMRSALIIGLPGVGKSLACKCAASIFNWSAVVLDIGSLKGSLVGETEKNTRLACKTIDAFGKAIVVVDEIERAFSGSGRTSMDTSGVSSSMLGYFLTWMQERKSEGILLATANDISALPPELLRAGRFDVIFFVDYPNKSEIEEIINIMNRRYQSNIPNNNEFQEKIHEQQWTGAELEQLAKDSHYTDNIEEAMGSVSLLSNFRKEEIKEIRSKCQKYRIANLKKISKKKIKRRFKKRTIGFA